MDASLIGIGLVVLLNLVAVAYGYGKLKQEVAHLGNDISHIRADIERIFSKLEK